MDELHEYQRPIPFKQKGNLSYMNEIIRLTHTNYTTQYTRYINYQYIDITTTRLSVLNI